MAESQLACLEDGHIPDDVPESEPAFYYSEAQRGALEELLRSGDGAFKTRLGEDRVKDFLSAREIKTVRDAFRAHRTDSDDGQRQGAAAGEAEADAGGRSTYWPQLSDTDVPPLELGWPGGGRFRGVTRVAVHTHPPKDNGPRVKEVVRRLIQQAAKVVALVMDLLTDLQILQDLLDAAWRRSVAVYVLLDARGVPHFLDMCGRLGAGQQQLKNMRVRTLEGAGLGLSFGRLPGSLCNKYMLVDGDKVMFGSYSFTWSSSRVDRNMITVMTGQVVDAFDRDFRELYAVSHALDLYEELHVRRPAASPPARPPPPQPRRPPLPATTSRFQVSLGDALKVPAHKYHNPKYSLVFGEARSLRGPAGVAVEVPVARSEKPDARATPPPSGGGGASGAEKPGGETRLSRFTPFRGKPGRGVVAGGDSAVPSAASVEANGASAREDSVTVAERTAAKQKNRKLSKPGAGRSSLQDAESIKSRRRSKNRCAQS